jgi:hypothetical protein
MVLIYGLFILLLKLSKSRFIGTQAGYAFFLVKRNFIIKQRNSYFLMMISSSIAFFIGFFESLPPPNLGYPPPGMSTHPTVRSKPFRPLNGEGKIADEK